MDSARSAAGSTFWRHRAIVSGGCVTGKRITRRIEYFNPNNETWNQLNVNLPMCLGGHSLVCHGKNLLLMGGLDKEKACKTVWEVDPQQKDAEWKPLPPMKYPSAFFTGIALDSEIYAIGGWQETNASLKRVEIFDGKRWRLGPSLPDKLSYHSAVIIPQHLADRLCHYAT